MKSWARWLLVGVSALAAVVLYRLIASSRREEGSLEAPITFDRAA